MDGILLINKEKGPTSFAVIEQVKRKFKLKKIGHGGTLDPMAEGVLIALINKATKINDYLDYPKEYEIEATFGIATNTDDTEGEVIRQAPVPEGLEQKIRDIIPSFTGEIMQAPPVYSAVRKDGKKLYELARKGIEVKPEPRKALIHSIELLRTEGSKVYLRVLCASGTYMRSLARDMGEKAGSAACLSALTRTKIGKFTALMSKKISEIESVEANLIPISEALYEMPSQNLSKYEADLVTHGNPIKNQSAAEGSHVKLIAGNEVVAIGQVEGKQIKIKRGI